MYKDYSVLYKYLVIIIIGCYFMVIKSMKLC